MQPDVSFHVNGGPVAMPDEDYPRVLNESTMALQLCTAGNLRTTLMLTEMVLKAEQFDRLLIATDTPTGSGIMPLGMLYTIAHLSSLTDLPPERFICAATGSNAKVYGLDSGLLAPGKAAPTEMVGKSTSGSGATGSTPYATAPARAMAIVSSVVATGLRMNGSEILMQAQASVHSRLAHFSTCARTSFRDCQRKCR